MRIFDFGKFFVKNRELFACKKVSIYSAHLIKNPLVNIMKNLRKFILALAMACHAGLALAGQASDPAQDMPQAAADFIKANFPGAAVASVAKSGSWFSREYDVALADSTKIKFDSSGTVHKIENKTAGLPLSLLPQKAAETLEIKFIGSKIAALEHKRNLMKVELFDGRVLLFDKKTHILISVEN